MCVFSGTGGGNSAGIWYIEADFYLFFTHCVMDSFKFILSYKIRVALIKKCHTDFHYMVLPRNLKLFFKAPQRIL